MRDFNQANLDARLSEIAQNLTPDQAAQVKQRVQEKVSAANLDLSPDAVDGAFDLLGSHSLSDVGGLLGGLGRWLGSVPEMGGDLLDKAGDLGSSAGDFAESAGDLAGIIVEALGDVLGSLDFDF